MRNKYAFLDDLKKLIEDKDKFAVSTLKKRLNKLISEFDEIIYYDLSAKKYYDNLLQCRNDTLKVLQTGIVEYSGGFFKIKNVVEIFKNEKGSITCVFKNGNTKHLSKDFDFLLNIYK